MLYLMMSVIVPQVMGLMLMDTITMIIHMEAGQSMNAFVVDYLFVVNVQRLYITMIMVDNGFVMVVEEK